MLKLVLLRHGQSVWNDLDERLHPVVRYYLRDSSTVVQAQAALDHIVHERRAATEKQSEGQS
jgi:hypothetical protein